MDELSLLLFRRYVEILKKASSLRRELSALDEERDRVSIAAEAINLDLDDVLKEKAHLLPKYLQPTDEDALKVAEPAEVTIKEAAVRILESQEDGMTANQILEFMRSRFNLSYARSSLSPQLSRLKADGEIDLAGGKWFRKITARPKAERHASEPPATAAHERRI